MPQLFCSSLKCLGIFIGTALFVQFISSCTKSSPLYIGDDTTTNPPKDTTTTPPKDTTTTPPKDTTVKGRSFVVGAGSGNLIVDGSNFVVNGNKIDLKNGDTVKIKGGSYNSIAIRNISAPAGARVLFINSGQVVLNGGKLLSLSNLNNVTISGAGESATARGFTFINSNYRAVLLSGAIDNFTLQNMLFQNVQDYVISYTDINSRLYNGASNSFSSNLAFLNLDAYNVGPFIMLGGDVTPNGFTGLIKKLEIANILCTNSPSPGSVVSVGDVEDFFIHDNRVDQVNANNNNHNGIFFVRGNGKFFNNTVTNHQGNALRLWLYSVDATKTVEIYNNVAYNSRMYSGFEIQVPPYIKACPVFKPAMTKVYNNTVGKMNTSRMTFPGRLLDFYNTYGSLELYNNLVFNNNDDIIVNNMSSTPISKNEKNIYIANELNAVEDFTKFKSKVADVGADIR